MDVAIGELPQSHTATKHDKAINNIMSINALMCTDSTEHSWAGHHSDNSGGGGVGGGSERIKDTTDSDTEQEDSLTQDPEPQHMHEPSIDTKPPNTALAPSRQDEDLASKKAARKQSSFLAKKPKLPKRIESPKQVLDLTSLGTLGTYNRQLLLQTSTSEICRNDLAILHHVFRHSRRLVVITGAGISVAAGIPDFRSSTGLFKLLKNDLKLKASGKQLFDASVVYNDLDSTNHFHGIMCDLYNLCFSSPPTPFHNFINEISQQSRLLRLYTQNIDCIDTSLSHLATKTPLEAPWPQTVQLHGTIKYMNCAKCNWTSEFDPKLFEASATASTSDDEDCEASSIPECPECLKVNSDRSIAGKRQQGVGRLRPKIVLYNEFNPDAEAIGRVTEGDLACRPDGLIVVGTSLKIPGVRRMVREMAQAVHAANGATVWMNIDDPPPQITKREFEGSFDLVVKGDCQIMPDLIRDYEQERDEIEERKAQERKAKMEAREAARALRQKQIQEREERRKKQGISAAAAGKDGKVAKKKSAKTAVAAGRSASEIKQSKPAVEAKQQAVKARKLKTTGATVDLVMPDNTPEPALNISPSSSSVSSSCSSSEEGHTDASSRDTSPPIPGPYAHKSHSLYEYGTGNSFLASPLPFLASMPSQPSAFPLDSFKLNSLPASTGPITMPKHRTLGVGKKRSVSGTIPASTGVNSISKVSK